MKTGAKIAVAVVCFAASIWLLVPVFGHIATLVGSPNETDERLFGTLTAETQKMVDAIVERLSKDQGRPLRAAFLPSFVNRDLSQDYVKSQTVLFGNFSPADSPVLIPLWTGVPLDEAYGSFLSDSFESEKEKLVLGDETKTILNDLVRRYERKIAQQRRASTSALSQQALGKTFDALVHQIGLIARIKSKDHERLLDLIKAYSEYSVTLELDDEDEPSVWVSAPRLDVEKDTGNRYKVVGDVEIASMPPEPAAVSTIPATLLAQEYEFVPLERPLWFRMDLLRDGQREAVTDQRLARYFGPSGYLSRIPVGFIVERISNVILSPTSQQSGIEAFLQGHPSFRVSAGGFDYVVNGLKSKNAFAKASLTLALANPRIRVVSVISEVLQ